MAGMSYSLNLSLGDAPDANLPPEVWQELNKLSLACKFIANSLQTISQGGSNAAHLVGTPAEGVSIQDYAQVQIIPSFHVTPGMVLELAGYEGINPTSGTHPYPVAMSEGDIPAGTSGFVTLLGMVWYQPGGLTPGAKYYVDQATSGAITTNPAAGRFVGQAFAADVIFFDPIRV